MENCESFNTVALLVRIADLTNKNQQLILENREVKLETQLLKMEIQRVKENHDELVKIFLREKAILDQQLIASQANPPSHTQKQGDSTTSSFEQFSRKRQFEGGSGPPPNAKRHQEQAGPTNDHDDHTME